LYRSRGADSAKRSAQGAAAGDCAVWRRSGSRRVRLDPDRLLFGVSSGQGGIGWFIFENRNLLNIPAVFAGLLTVIVIGLIVENLIFRTIVRNTLQKWGSQS
jgi:hypothetical protein